MGDEKVATDIESSKVVCGRPLLPRPYGEVVAPSRRATNAGASVRDSKSRRRLARKERLAMKNLAVVLSDVHIGSNDPTNWYQGEVHEPYLVAALDWVVANADSVRELIVLGDLVDFWTYVPSDRPPSI